MLCNACPRKCNVDRLEKMGVCGVVENPKIAKVYLHKWEEPIISNGNGSGTIFFSGCNLKCVYCQNFEISSNGYGKEVSVERLAEIFKELESMGACNINLVTPSHYVLAIKKALDIYKPNIPIVYNTSGYDSVESLELIKDYIDVYLVDFKYYDNNLAKIYSNAFDYPDVVKKAIKKMREFKPKEVIENGVLKSGVLIRHLVLPNLIDDSKSVLKWISENITNPFISLMGQYTPMYRAKEFKDIDRVLKPIEYKIVYNYMISLGLKNGYTQELSSASDTYIPKFDCEGV